MFNQTKYMREYRKRPKHIAYMREYQQGSECKAKHRVRSLARYYTKRDEILVKQRGRRKTGKYRAVNAIRQGNRRALKQNSGVEITVEQWRDICERFSRRCAYCGIHEDVLQITFNQRLTIDHVIPLSRGGQHVLENVVPACARCNLSKGTKLINSKKA